MSKKLILLLVMTSAISGCGPWSKEVPKATPIGAGCSGFGIINPSRKDTLGTKQQVSAHNDTYRELCPEKK